MRTVLNCAVLLLALTLAAPRVSAQPRNYSEGGYANRHSVAVGESIAFHIATSRAPFDVQIVNMASPFTVLQTLSGLTSQARDCTGKWETGCEWPVTANFAVPASFTPGYYAARFPTSEGQRHIMFAVRPVVPGSYAPIAVIQPSNSDVAYNRFGGKSVYDPISDDGKRAHIVSFDRPYFEDEGFARYHIWEDRFVKWMKAENRKFEVITDSDMEAGLSLAGYKALVIVGHSEYWSLNARRHLEAYSRSGGHIAVFGANTMWWQVRVDLQKRQMTVYKDASLDPMTGVHNELVTTNFTDWPVLNPENSILGASFLNAAYVNRRGHDRVPLDERAVYTVRKADHWALAGTGLMNGMEMGRSIAAIEVDGALFNTLPDGRLEVEGSDGTPLSYEILATLPASDGYATIGMYVNAQGGAVFNGAARDWSYGLASDPVVQQITRNVLDRFSTGELFAYAPRTTVNLAEDRFNTPPSSAEYLPGWRYFRSGLTPSPRCAREGASGLELTGPLWTLVLRNLAVGPLGIWKTAGHVWLNADLLESAPTYPTTLVGLMDYRGPQRITTAALLMHKRPDGLALSMASFSGTTVAHQTEWIVMHRGWNSVSFEWEPDGPLRLNVSGHKASTWNDVRTGVVTAIMLEFPGSVSTGSLCADHLQLRSSFAPVSMAKSMVTSAHGRLTANGRSTSEVFVRLLDADGNPLLNGGETVALTTSLGTLTNVRDNGDGSYTATLNAGSTPGTATIRATVNGETVEQVATVTVQAPVADATRRRSVR